MSIRVTILPLIFGLSSLVSSPTPAAAAEVFVNGVKITEGALKGTVFDNVSVRFDARGDVFIVAPGYRVESEPTKSAARATPASPTSPPPRPAGPTGRRYWLVVNTATTGVYKLLINANGSPVAEIDPNRRQYVVDVTAKLQQGVNRVELTYLPIPGAAFDGGDVSDVIVGLGKSAPDGTLTISRVLATHQQPGGRRSAESVNLSFNLK